MSLDTEKWVEWKSFSVLTGNEVPDEGRFYTLERSVTSGCHFPTMGICPFLPQPRGVNPDCLWDPLAVHNPGISPLRETQGGAKAAGPFRSSGFVFPFPEDPLGEPLQFALGFSAVKRAHGAFGGVINGWQPQPCPQPPPHSHRRGKAQA